ARDSSRDASHKTESDLRLAQPDESHQAYDYSTRHAQEQTCAQLATQARGHASPRWPLTVQQLQGEADRLAADALGQVQRHWDEEGQGHHAVQLVLIDAGKERSQNAGREIAPQPGKAMAEGR